MWSWIFFFALLLFLTRPAFCAPIVGGAPQGVTDKFLPEGKGIKTEVWVKDLEIPWSLLFLDERRALVSERPGKIRLIEEGKLREKPFAVIEVAAVGEGGLMGLAAHPGYPQKPYIYAMHTYRKNGGLLNRVIRLQERGEEGASEKVVVDGIPGARFHNGGRIAFGPDGLLYITAGETGDPDLAQDVKSLAGKILRLTPEGEIPPDNPFKNAVYSYGHRNPQGISWHPRTKDLFSSEHGPSGEFGLSANDEINGIVKGGNFGWPKIVGAPGRKPFIDPFILWKKTTPPSGITFCRGKRFPEFKDDLFAATLRSEALIRIRVQKRKEAYHVEAVERWFAKDFDSGKFGRLRDVVEGPDGALYVLTNNRDGRGRPRPGDDKILRLVSK